MLLAARCQWKLFRVAKPMAPATLKVKATQTGKGKIMVTLTNAVNNPVAFFNRITLLDAKTKTRVLPVFYSDNYFSVIPGAEKDDHG